jgi:hypothetical protein
MTKIRYYLQCTVLQRYSLTDTFGNGLTTSRLNLFLFFLSCTKYNSSVKDI